jgi:putative endonuclease
MESKPEGHFVYMLKCADGTLYTGYARDLKKRVSEHNGKSKIEGAKYTRSRRPVKLLYHEELESRSQAQQREYAIKQLSRPQKQQLIKRNKLASQ